MIKWLSLIPLVLLLGGCGAHSKLNIVSPSMSEDEVRERANVVITEKTQATNSGEAATEKKSGEESTASAPSKEMRHTEGPSVSGERAQEALINLLEKKGVITKNELQDEMEKLGQSSK
jgi:hypothetical protein